MQITATASINIKPALLSFNAMRFELIKQLAVEQEIVRRLYKATTTTWNHKPVFAKETKIGTDTLSYTVSTNHLIYFMQHEGTTKKNYRIPKVVKKGKRLHYQEGFKPKTQVRVIGSTSGGKFGDWVHPVAVTHPGYEGRKWTEEIVKMRQKPFQENMEKAVERGLKRMGVTS